MKTLIVLVVIVASLFCYSFFTPTKKPGDPVYIKASKQRTGNAEAGYQYLIEGDYLKSGIPFALFKMASHEKVNDLGRTGINQNIPYSFNAVTAPNGQLVVSPNCLTCHAQKFEGKLVIGLGNSLSDYTSNHASTALFARRFLSSGAVKDEVYDAAKNFLRSVITVYPGLVAKSRGVNIADRLAALLASHRDPKTFQWSDSALMSVPDEVIPSDVPAWWLLKKKHAMFYTGFGRGDFGRFLMAANLLTVTDTTEAATVDSHFNDVLAYIYSIKPPKYPKPVNKKLVADGRLLFETYCSDCHGTYGRGGSYPNLLIPEEVIQTDSALYSANYSNPQFVNWFNQSWFTTGDHPAKLVPFRGYIAPPLDGVWATAPYLHNGSVPTLEALLDSKLRPTYWSRDFKNPQYDLDDPGWKYTTESAATNKDTYNTTLRGYSNKGHYFGDKLTQKERTAVIEYLKTL